MFTLWLSVVDAEMRRVSAADVRAMSVGHGRIALRFEGGRRVGQGPPGARVTIDVSAPGFEPEEHTVSLRDEVTQVVIGLRQARQPNEPRQLSYNYGDDRLAFDPVRDAFLIHVQGAGATKAFDEVATNLVWKDLSHLTDDLVARVTGTPGEAERLFARLRREHKLLHVEFLQLIQHGNRPARGLTNELVGTFQDEVQRADVDQLAAAAGLTVLRQLSHDENAFVLVRSGPPSYDVLEAADALSRDSRVRHVEPNIRFLVTLDQYVPNDPLWALVPHLQLIKADKAWAVLGNVSDNLRGGSSQITIAIIDPDGVAPDHPDLISNLTDGTPKLVTSVNFLMKPPAPQEVADLGGNHGTQCAASAAAAFDDDRGLPGVAPNCRLIGARISVFMNAVLLADIYRWAAGFGSTAPDVPAPPPRAADVISSSYGSLDLSLSETMRNCFDLLTSTGRGGRGCVLCFSIGNAGYVDFTETGENFRPWAAYKKTLAVGASISTNPTNPVDGSDHMDPNGNTANIATSVDTRALYSPFGSTALRKPDLVAPSHTARVRGFNVDPVLSAVKVGEGDVDGCPPDRCNDYAKTFGGTSHSTATVAGAVALILSARPDLNWMQVRTILRRSCARIDAGQAHPTGQWLDSDGDGLIDYSQWYGAGRLDVVEAVALALAGTVPVEEDTEIVTRT